MNIYSLAMLTSSEFTTPRVIQLMKRKYNLKKTKIVDGKNPIFDEKIIYYRGTKENIMRFLIHDFSDKEEAIEYFKTFATKVR